MKLAWIVYRDEGDEPLIQFTNPGRRHYYFKVVQIVYSEIEDGDE